MRLVSTLTTVHPRERERERERERKKIIQKFVFLSCTYTTVHVLMDSQGQAGKGTQNSNTELGKDRSGNGKLGRSELGPSHHRAVVYQISHWTHHCHGSLKSRSQTEPDKEKT